jgi:hypothetical protein
MLTTVDNPFDPWTQYDEWYSYDTTKGHCSMQLLARVVKTSNELSEADQLLAIQQGIDEIVRENVSGLHRKVPQPVS